jgi:hypothetical protein
MKKLATTGVIVVAVLVLASLFLPTLAWSGGANVQFRFHVVESSGGCAIRDAKIRVIRDFQLQYLSTFPAVTTDATGAATIPVMCGAGGSQGLFRKTGRFVISHELLVEADGYRPLATGLANVVGGRRWPLSKRVFDVELVLFKNP